MERGRFFLAESEEVPEGEYYITYLSGDKDIVVVFEGFIDSKVDAFMAIAAINHHRGLGLSVYAVTNTEDYGTGVYDWIPLVEDTDEC